MPGRSLLLRSASRIGAIVVAAQAFPQWVSATTMTARCRAPKMNPMGALSPEEGDPGGRIGSGCAVREPLRGSKSRERELRGGEWQMTQSDPSSRSLRHAATSRLAGATAAVAGRVVGAGVKGVIGGIQGAASGIRDGWRKGSLSVAGRPGRAWARGVIGGIQGAGNGIRDGWSKGS